MGAGHGRRPRRGVARAADDKTLRAFDNPPFVSQPPVDNRTEFAVFPQLLLDRDGEKLVTIVKATYELDADGALRIAPPERRRGVRFADVPWDDKKPESLAYPGDVCLRKPATDVVLVARAWPPPGRPVSSVDVRVEVGPVKKSLVVYGRRVWLGGGAGLSSPAPFDGVDMTWDNAWGGRDDSDPAALLEEPRNPAGSGVSRKPASLAHQPAPQIEDPAYPIQSAQTRPPPAGIGPVGRGWEPRRRHAGTYDAAWLETRAPLPPDDFDDRFNQCAPPGLVADPPLRGGEAVRLLGLAPEGARSFQLPRGGVQIEFQVKDREPAAFFPHLDTVLLDLFETGPEKPIAVELVWRAHVKAPRRMKDAKVVVREWGGS